MAMTMNGEVQLSATRDKVWAMLNDPEVLKVCIPGCEMLDMNGDNEFQAIASVKVEPIFEIGKTVYLSATSCAISLIVDSSI